MNDFLINVGDNGNGPEKDKGGAFDFGGYRWIKEKV